MRAWLAATLLLLVLALAPAAANAASIAYVDNGEVWLSSLDGTQKVRLASPVVNSAGKTEKWLDVAASDGGRIVAARNEPGKISRSSWFKVWEPNGTSTVEGPLNAPAGWTTYVYPLGFDITADGKHMVYGFSNSSGCCPISFGQGFYARPVTNSVLDPITVSGQEDPTLFGNRVIAHAGATVGVQTAAGAPYGSDLTPWADTSATGLEQRRTDIAANGQLAALELEEWNGGSQTVGKVALLSIQGVDQSPTFPAAVDCFIPATGIATEVSLSADAKRVSWVDDQGLRVAGAPTTSADPCALSSPPVVISSSGRYGSIGGANVSAFLPGSPGGPGAGQPPGSEPTGRKRPVVTVPSRLTAAALASRRGAAVKVRVDRAGRVKITATVAAAVMARKRRPVVVARGSALAKRAGTVTVRLRLTASARRKPRRLKGARMTLRVSHGGMTTIKKARVR